MKQLIILSYPRSGNTLMRTHIEMGLHIRTIGYNSEIDMSPIMYQATGFRDYRNDWIGIKRHDLNGFKGNEPLIYIERPMGEAIKSHYAKESKIHNLNWDKFFEVEKLNWEDAQYYSHKWTGSKIKIKYDDLVNNEVPIDEIATMLGVSLHKYAGASIHALSIYRKELAVYESNK